MTEIDSRLSRRRFLQASAAVGATVSLGGITAACNVVGQTAQGGTFNWMTWGDHYIDTQLKAIETSDKITTQISELAGNAEGFAKLKEVKGELDKISGDALWVPDAYFSEGLIEPFDINELKVSSQLYPFARQFEIWTKPEGYLGYPFGWSPISICGRQRIGNRSTTPNAPTSCAGRKSSRRSNRNSKPSSLKRSACCPTRNWRGPLPRCRQQRLNNRPSRRRLNAS